VKNSCVWAAARFKGNCDCWIWLGRTSKKNPATRVLLRFGLRAIRSRSADRPFFQGESKKLPLFEIAFVLVRLDHVAGLIVDASVKDFSRQNWGGFCYARFYAAVPPRWGFGISPFPQFGNARHGEARPRAAWHGQRYRTAWQVSVNGVNGRRFPGGFRRPFRYRIRNLLEPPRAFARTLRLRVCKLILRFISQPPLARPRDAHRCPYNKRAHVHPA
jgi:hypothetical protein